MSVKRLMRNEISLRGLFLGLQQQMIASLSTNREVILHPGAKGDASELHWLKMLNDYLPERYRADKAFVIDCKGSLSEQIDVVIYDRHYSPFLFNQDGAKYIPAESVYAVFEVKQEISGPYIKYAQEKAASVRRLRRTSAIIPHAGGTYKPKRPPRILAGILALESSWSPPFGAALNKALNGATQAERLDFGCALKQGAFEVQYPTNGRSSIKKGNAKTALIFFFLTLLGRLQKNGTVAALKFDTYAQVLDGDI
jgi:hypothetical protein